MNEMLGDVNLMFVTTWHCRVKSVLLFWKSYSFVDSIAFSLFCFVYTKCILINLYKSIQRTHTIMSMQSFIFKKSLSCNVKMFLNRLKIIKLVFQNHLFNPVICYTVLLQCSHRSHAMCVRIIT